MIYCNGERSYITYYALKEGRGLDFFAEPYTVEGICSVLLYVTEWEGVQKTNFVLRNKRSFPMYHRKNFRTEKPIPNS
jgi:hypothetical protein